MKRAVAMGAALFLLPLLVRLLVAQSSPPSQAPPPPPTYTLTDLGPLNISAVTSGATALNASGQVTGFRLENFTSPVCFASGANRAFLWDNGTYTELGTLGIAPNPGASSSAYGINNAGEVVGMSEICPSGTSAGQRAFIWQNGTMTALDPSTSSSDSSVALAINTNGDVAGYLSHANAAVAPQAVIWKGGTAAGLTVLPTLACQFTVCETRALAINDSGQAAGWGMGPVVTGPFGTYNASQAVMWDTNGQPTGLGSLGSYFNDQANAINSQGAVVGYSQNGPSTVHAVLWQNGTMTDLGAIPGIDPIFGSSANITDNSSGAWGINTQGYIVGISGFGSSAVFQGNGGRAFLYIPTPAPGTGGTMYDLLSLLAPGTNWARLEAAWGINDAGQIVGVGIDASQQEHGFLLTPIITPTTTTISASANSSVFGQPVSFSVSVTPTQSSPLTPTGNVTFSDGSTVLGTAALSSGTAIFNDSALSVGAHSITASYAGDGNFGSSTSAAVNESVSQAGTTIALAASPNPANFNQAVTLTATVTVVAPGAGTPTGTVNFLDGGTLLGTAALSSAGNATFSTSSLTTGSHSLTASYSGDTDFSGSASATTSQSVVVPAPVITSPVSGFNTTNSSVTVTGTGTFGALVAILDGTTTVASVPVDPSGNFGVTIALAVGAHSLTATQTLGAATSAASAAVSVTIAPPPPVIASPASGFSTTIPSVTVSVSGMPGALVTVLDGTVTVGTGTVNSAGSFSVTVTLAVGGNSLTATQTLNGVASAASAAVTGTVLPPPVVITDNENITVSDTTSSPDVFSVEAVHINDAVFVTPLINVVAPVAEFSTGSLGFSGQSGSQTITVSDIGTASLTLASATVSGSSQFAITQIACSNLATAFSTMLPSGGACVLTIGYSASATPASDNGTLVFTDNAALSNMASVPSGSSYTQSIALNGSGTSTPPLSPPPAVIPLLDRETITVTDTQSFQDVVDPEKITVIDHVSIQVLNTTTTSISLTGSSVYGTAESATVSVRSSTAAVTGNVTLSVDGGAPSSMSLTNGSATFNLGILKAGNHSLSANFAAQGNFLASSAQTAIAVAQATPTLTWAMPAAITYPTPLSSAQLNATASVPGIFAYAPPAGTVLNPGAQILSATFTPSDKTDYQTVTKSVSINVNVSGNLVVQSGQTVTFTNGSVGGSVTLTGGTLTLTGSTVGGNLTMTSGTLTLNGNSIVSGNVQIQGGSFSIGPASIKGNAQITNIPSGTAPGVICGANINGTLQFQGNRISAQIGSASCSGNTISGNLQVINNAAPLQIYKNSVAGNLQITGNTGAVQVFSNTARGILQCSSNASSLTGGGNTAAIKQGQCATF